MKKIRKPLLVVLLLTMFMGTFAVNVILTTDQRQIVSSTVENKNKIQQIVSSTVEAKIKLQLLLLETKKDIKDSLPADSPEPNENDLAGNNSPAIGPPEPDEKNDLVGNKSPDIGPPESDNESTDSSYTDKDSPEKDSPVLDCFPPGSPTKTRLY